jgi:hypothetical protein
MPEPEGGRRRTKRWRQLGLTIGVEASGETVAQGSVELRARRREDGAAQIEEAPKGGAAGGERRRPRPQ